MWHLILVGSGGHLKFSISNFPYVVSAADVIVGYGDKIANVEMLQRHESTAATDLTVSFADSVGAGNHRVALYPAVRPEQAINVDIEFKQRINVNKVAFADPYATSIEIRLSGAVGKVNGVAAQQQFLCSDMIDAASVTMLGTDTCIFNTKMDTITAHIKHTFGTTLTPGSTLTFLSDKTESDNGLSTMAAESFSVTSSDITITATARISGPTEVGLCADSVTWEGKDSEGAGLLSYTWSSTDQSLNYVFQSLSPTAAEVEISAEQLPNAGKSFQICLMVTDLYGSKSQSECRSLSKASLPKPTVEISGSRTLNIDQSNRLEGFGELSTCGGAQNLADTSLHLQYEWRLPTNMNAPSVTTSNRNLILPKDSLAANTEYTFELLAWAKGTPSNIGRAAMTVKTGFPELRCLIKGSGGEASTIKSLDLDASSSFDPAGQTLEITWVCSQRQGSSTDFTECRDSAGNVIQATTTGVLGKVVVAANTLSEATYDWEATVRAPASGRMKPCVISYSMKAQKVLDLEMLVPRSPVIRYNQYQSGTNADLTYQFIAIRDQKLTLECIASANQTESVEFVWLNTEGYINLNSDTRVSQIAAVGQETQQSTLVLAPGMLIPGTLATFNCTAAGANTRGSSSLRVFTNSAPSGKC